MKRFSKREVPEVLPPPTKILSLAQAPINLFVLVLKAYYDGDWKNGQLCKPWNPFGQSFLITALQDWPALLAGVELGSAVSDTDGKGGVSTGGSNIIQQQFLHDKCTAKRQELIATSKFLINQLISNPQYTKQLALGRAIPREIDNFGEEMTEFFRMEGQRFEEPVRGFLDYILLSIYIDAKSLWLDSDEAKHLMARFSTDQIVLARQVAARFFYSTDDFAHFLDWADGKAPGRLRCGLKENWLAQACCRWACRRLGADDSEDLLAYMTQELPKKYSRHMEALVSKD